MGKAIIYKDRRIRQGEDPGTSDKKTVIFSMPGSPNAVKTASNIIIDEFPHLVFHAKK